MEPLQGILLIDKPAGWTSFDVVAKVRGVMSTELRSLHEQRGFCTDNRGAESGRSVAARTDLNEERALQMNDKAVDFKNGGGSSLDAGRAFRCKCRVKVGHAGTLDPFATGLLVLAVGKSTKQIDTLMKLDKVYDVQLTLGATSNTDDIDGEIVSTGKSRRITDLEELKRVLTAFVGDMQQIPPVYSAIKVDGKRAYKRARDGEIVEMKPRQVTIRAITNIGYKHPVLSFQAEVSSGTYIRSLARDIGERLGQGAHVSALRRISVGDDSVHDALLMTELNSGSIHQFLKTDKLPLD